jgi:hypothetical protein
MASAMMAWATAMSAKDHVQGELGSHIMLLQQLRLLPFPCELTRPSRSW